MKGIMKTQDVLIQYSGLRPDNTVKNFVESVAQEIHEEAPGGSTIRIVFKKSRNHLKGLLRINSYAGSFFAVADESNIKDVTFQLLGKIRRRLDKWKSTRFHSKQTIGPASLT
jgi:hypothetical protein